MCKKHINNLKGLVKVIKRNRNQYGSKIIRGITAAAAFLELAQSAANAQEAVNELNFRIRIGRSRPEGFHIPGPKFNCPAK
jgi:hypothetical protein